MSSWMCEYLGLFRSDAAKPWPQSAMAISTKGLFALEPISSRQPVQPAVPQQRAGELDDGQVVLRLLLVPDDDSAAPVQPRDRPLDHPPPRLVPLAAVGDVPLLLAALPAVRVVTQNPRRPRRRRAPDSAVP